MKGWRARLGFLVPPGNPTVEPEMQALAPQGVSLHFTRMTASGPAGTHEGQEERNRSQIDSIESCSALLAMVSPQVIVMAHTATSYTLGSAAEAALVARIEQLSGTRFITAFGSVLAALEHLNVRRIAYATPYNEVTTLQGKRHLEEQGIEVVSYGQLANVRNIYEENDERAYAIARAVDRPDADAVFLSGVGMPTLDALQVLENDLGKPVISAASAMMWNALRVAGVQHSHSGYGRLLS
ncbi:maleate isomerase [Paramixta manurensis]|uniref:Maleate isomerase n=1 Tax=Paramixta manurensis TaxID=2740817 RepID=A0A6M8UCK9_9GAMM|nr:maleate isomerase [Erwiniaceae bacterium PD-1]